VVIKDVMTSDVVEVGPDAALAEAVQLLEEKQAGVLAVYEGGTLLGTVTEHDIAAWLAGKGNDPSTATVQDVMRREAGISREDQDIREVARMMKEQHLNDMVVMRGDQPVGTVSLADLATNMSTDDGRGSAVGTQAQIGATTQTMQALQAAPAPRAAQAVEFTTPPPTRIFLQPVASPSVLGLYAFAAATLIFGAFYAGWFGSAITPLYIAPFLALLGLAQLLAGMWAYKARDGLSTVTFGVWGSFWLAYGIVYLLIGNHTLAAAAFPPQFGWWFIPLVGITIVTMAASIGRNVAGAVTWLLLAVAALLACIGFLTAKSTWNTVSGYFFMASAVFAFYTASAMLLEDTYRRVVLPIGKPLRDANVPGRQVTRFVEYQYGEPGVRAGQ